MFEKVNPSHPDKVADRIAGAIVDIAYKKEKNPKVAVEVLIGHGKCHIINETSVKISQEEIDKIVKRIAGAIEVDYIEVPQDIHLAINQSKDIRCGDNGIFKGTPITTEQMLLTAYARNLYNNVHADGKYIIDRDKIVVCQSNIDSTLFRYGVSQATRVNPLGDWTGGTDVDTGATNRKLGSDMGDSVTGGGLHGKDLSKADVSVNIYCWLKAQATGKPVTMSCAIGDTCIAGIKYSEIVETARQYIKNIGGFEKFAEWGLI